MEKHVENVGDNVLHLTVKDYKRFGRNKVIGETAISFDKINSAYCLEPDSPDSVPLIEIPLVKLGQTPASMISKYYNFSKLTFFSRKRER
jgi:C2 domain